MAVKNGGYTAGAVVALALWEGHCMTRREERTPLLFALGIVAEILFCFKKDCSGKPDP